jgi:hypothetical protein
MPIPLKLHDLPSHTLFLKEPPSVLFHYTSLDGANGIVRNKSLRMTKLAYMNDRSELGLAIDLFRREVDRYAEGGADHKSFLTEMAHQLGGFAETNICAISFCEHEDLLSQWRAYASSGVALASHAKCSSRSTPGVVA